MSELEQPLTCAFHPKRETQLRCNRCDKPICIKCATHTPTGYRCPECIRTQQKVFVTTRWFDQIIAAVITGLIAILGAFVSSFVGFYTIFIALGAGMLTVWVVKKAIQNRRSPLLKYVMGGSALLAGLAPVAARLFTIQMLTGNMAGISLWGLVWDLGYAVILAANIFYQLRN